MVHTPPGPTPHLDRVRSRPYEIDRTITGGHVSGDQIYLRELVLQVAHRSQGVLGVTVGDIQNQHIHSGSHATLGAPGHLPPHPQCCAHHQVVAHLLHLFHLPRMVLHRQESMNYPDSPHPRHGHGHLPLTDGVHVGGQHRDVERDATAETGTKAHLLAGSHRRATGYQQHIVIGEGEGKFGWIHET